MGRRRVDAGRGEPRHSLGLPMSIYEVHLGSWRRVPEEGNRSLSYRELAHAAGRLRQGMGFTHVEFCRSCEHPFYGSWGYQPPATSRRRAATARRRISCISSTAAPARHRRDPRLGAGALSERRARPGLLRRHAPLRARRSAARACIPTGTRSIFNYGRNEVRNFLISNALFWLDEYHVDGLRVDAVASMLYLDYSRDRQANGFPTGTAAGRTSKRSTFCAGSTRRSTANIPDVHTIAEESTAWPMVSRPTYVGGLGFGLKWNMGWMHDTLAVHVAGPDPPQLPSQPHRPSA